MPVRFDSAQVLKYLAAPTSFRMGDFSFLMEPTLPAKRMESMNNFPSGMSPSTLEGWANIAIPTLSTAPVTYTYGSDPGSYSVGRLTAVSNGSATSYTYDPAGQITASTQQTSGQNYSFSYTYNLAGSLVSETYPSGRVVTTTYDGAKRAAQVSGV